MCVHYYQLWSPPLSAVVPNCWTWKHSWETQEPLQPPWAPSDTHQKPHNYQCHGPNGLSLRDIMPPETQCHPALSLGTCNTRPRATTCSSVPPLSGENLSYWSHFIKSERGDCFFKCTDNYTELQGSGKIRETLTPPKECCKPPVTGHKKMEIQELPDE